MVKLADDNGSDAPRLLAAVPGLPIDVQPLVYWLLAASPNEEVGQQAAAILYGMLGATPYGSREWKAYLESSPRRARQRLESVARVEGGRLIVVNAASRTGALLGSFEKGRTITLQYVEGAWMLGTDNPAKWPERNPDDAGEIPGIYRCALRLRAAGGNETVRLVEGGTKATPFFLTIQEDSEVWMACNDAVVGNRIDNNRGTATYRFSVR
jgi:hypothetical protein